MNDRRSVLKGLAGLAVLSNPALGQQKVARNPGFRIQLALNVYSFNQPLRSGAMTLEDVVDYCAQHGIDALDATGYYFPGYPKVPSDEYIYRLKRKAFVNGVKVIGTGVRNNFAVPDPEARRRDVQLVKDWIEVAGKLGASVIRVFSGSKALDAGAFDRALEWMVPDFKECAAYGASRGVIVGLQNHDDFLRTAAETIRVVEAVNSEWFGVILDIGSLRQGDPYAEIERLLPYAVSWQLKENVWYGEKETPTDLAKIRTIIEKGGYRGYVPIETLGEGDPKIKVARFLDQVRRAFAV
ncbi:MAG TPA: sugar phosphate isomerase/epimerase family protein [Bryobacteraceae bacterium]|nr:sugar phosphate isomerase/epimerase family protein [Bryobacteraceae bacterium]